MINSVYDVLDAYKRQGRINLQAAKRCLPGLGNTDNAWLKQEAAVPSIEFLVDCYSVANSLIGQMIRRGNTHGEDWYGIENAIKSAIATTECVWEGQGRKAVLGLPVHDSIRDYIAQCIWLYRSGGKDEWREYADLSKQTVQKFERGDPEFSEFLSSKALIYFLPMFINGLTERNMEQIHCAYQWAQRGWLDADLRALHVLPWYRGWKNAFFCQFDDSKTGETLVVSDAQMDYLRQQEPSIYEWMLNPVDLSLCAPGRIYGIVTSEIVVSWVGGKTVNAHYFDDLDYCTVRSLRGLNPGRYVSGVTSGADGFRFLSDISSFVPYK